MTREQVIKGLEHCKALECAKCPYFTKYVRHAKSNDPCPMFDDAIALLKESEPVVHCKDCKWYKKGEFFVSNKFCFRLKDNKGKHIGYNFSDDHFCSFGERKDS